MPSEFCSVFSQSSVLLLSNVCSSLFFLIPSTLHYNVGSVHKALLLNNDVLWQLLWEKRLGSSFNCNLNKLLLFKECHFDLKEWLADKPWLSGCGHLPGIFSKMSLSLQGKQLTVFITKDNFQVLSKGEHLTHRFVNFLQLPKLKARKLLSIKWVFPYGV